jgi:hypothetical protein
MLTLFKPGTPRQRAADEIPLANYYAATTPQVLTGRVQTMREHSNPFFNDEGVIQVLADHGN